MKLKSKNEIPELPIGMDDLCISLYYVLNSLPGVVTYDSCCGHERDIYMMFFKCDNIDTLSRLGRATSSNYSDGQWEIMVDSTDTRPRGCFWLRTKNILKTPELIKSMDELIDSIKYWFGDEFDDYFEKDNYEYYEREQNYND